MRKSYPFLIIAILLVVAILVWSEKQNDRIAEVVTDDYSDVGAIVI